MPTALVTGSPERVPDVTIALKSQGFDILAAGAISAAETPDLEPRSVDCYVQLPVDAPLARAGALLRARDVIAHEMLARFDAAARLLPLLAPSATVVLVAGGPEPDFDGPPAGHHAADLRALRTLVGVLAEAILRDSGQRGLWTAVVGADCAPEEIAALASHRPPAPLPWWVYASIDPDLDFASWRDSILCLSTTRSC